MPSASRTSLALLPPVLAAMPNWAHSSCIVMYGVLALSLRKLTCPRA